MSPPCTLLRKTVNTTHGQPRKSLGQFGTEWDSLTHFLNFMDFVDFACKFYTVSLHRFKNSFRAIVGMDRNRDGVRSPFFYFPTNLFKKNMEHHHETVPPFPNCPKLSQTVPRKFCFKNRVDVPRQHHHISLPTERHNQRRAHGRGIDHSVHSFFRWISDCPTRPKLN